jgi:hypothetical protein
MWGHAACNSVPHPFRHSFAPQIPHTTQKICTKESELLLPPNLFNVLARRRAHYIASLYGIRMCA